MAKPPSDQELRVLRAMNRASDSSTATDVAKLAKIKHRGVYVVMSRLREKGYAVRKADGWTLSAAGKRVIKNA
jgi:sugar-specific transcriptional regulator TrmB